MPQLTLPLLLIRQQLMLRLMQVLVAVARWMQEQGSPRMWRTAVRGLTRREPRRACDAAMSTPMSPLNLRVFKQTWTFICEVLLPLAEEGVRIEPCVAGTSNAVVICEGCPASVLNAHVRAGTHLACMGTDTKGKQEVEASLLARAAVFTDEVAQSVTIGEAQHAVAAGLLQPQAITTLGDVLIGRHAGRPSENAVTLFDGTGVALQDLAVAAKVVERARAMGLGYEVAV